MKEQNFDQNTIKPKLPIESEEKLAVKKQEFRRLLTAGKENEELPQALFILAPGIKKRDGRGKGSLEGYRTVSYNDTNEPGYEKYQGVVVGGRDRVIAAAELGKAFPEITIVSTSTVHKSRPADAPTDAAIMASELVARGIPRERILLEETSNTTFTELVEMVKLAVKNNWSKIAVVTTGSHLPRSRKMFENLESMMSYDDPEFSDAIKEFRKRNIAVNFISADDVLTYTSKHYQHLLEKVEKLPGSKKIKELENQGIEHIEKGKYKVEKPVPNK